MLISADTFFTFIVRNKKFTRIAFYTNSGSKLIDLKNVSWWTLRDTQAIEDQRTERAVWALQSIWNLNPKIAHIKRSLIIWQKFDHKELLISFAALAPINFKIKPHLPILRLSCEVKSADPRESHFIFVQRWEVLNIKVSAWKASLDVTVNVFSCRLLEINQITVGKILYFYSASKRYFEIKCSDSDEVPLRSSDTLWKGPVEAWVAITNREIRVFHGYSWILMAFQNFGKLFD